MIHGPGCSFLTQKPDSTCVEFFVNCISPALQLSQAMVTLKRESKILQNQKQTTKNWWTLWTHVLFCSSIYDDLFKVCVVKLNNIKIQKHLTKNLMQSDNSSLIFCITRLFFHVKALDSEGCFTMTTKGPFVIVYTDKMSPPLSDTSCRKSKFKLKEAVSSSADMLIATAWL